MNEAEKIKFYDNVEFFEAIENGHRELVRQYLDNDASLIDAQTTYESIYEQIKGVTPLHVASMFCKIEIVELLYDRGANLDLQDSDGYTALMIASCTHTRLKIVELLYNLGADLDEQNKDGETALIIAAQQNNEKTVEFLCEHGADPTICDQTDQTAIDYAEQGSEIANKLQEALDNFSQKPVLK